jgi:hypothetical protein
MTRVRTLHCVLLCVALLQPWLAQALERRQLAVIVNTADPLSVEIGEYYAKRRRITFQNFIKVSFPPGQAVLSREEFESIVPSTIATAVAKRTIERCPKFWP